MRLIPGKTKVKIELFRGISLTDIAIGGVFGILVLFVILSSIPWKFVIAGVLAFIAVALLIRLDTEPNYLYIYHIIRHYGYRRTYERIFSDEELLRIAEVGEKDAMMESTFGKEPKRRINGYNLADIISFTGIADNFIEFDGEYYGAALEIKPIEFRFLSQGRRTNTIDYCFARILRSIPPQFAANIVKIERPIIFDDFIDNEYSKLDDQRNSFEKGLITEQELQSRIEVLYDRIQDLRDLSYNRKVVQPGYYLVLFDSDKQQLNNLIRTAEDTLRNGELNVHRLNTKELAIFLRYTNQIDFDEREIDRVKEKDYAAWAMPTSVQIRPRTVKINGILSHNMRVVNYPTLAGDAWLASVMSIPSTKVVVKCTPMDRAKAVRSIDHSLQELRGQYNATGVDSKRIELQEHIQTLAELLAMLQGDNETLLEVNVYVSAYDIHLTRNTLPKSQQPPPSDLTNISNMKRVIRRAYMEQGLRLNNMEFEQLNAFIGSQISAYDPMLSDSRGIPSGTLAACYPWIFAHVMDRGGIKLGTESGVPVFVDFFRRDTERVNSNMVIIGKSGSGKSYATKCLLTNLAADDSKIFILDPENEYTELADNLHGKSINVGNPLFGRLNPFQIITALDDDEGGSDTVSGSYATHLQFLEEFLRQIMPDCEPDAMEYLNSIVDRMYTNMGITGETDLKTLRPQDYPIFDDLYDAVLTEFQSTDNEYIRTMLRTLMNYVSKFSAGGRNANLWNGASTVTTDENFTVFNFQNLLANRNGTIANAQMLLVLKYIDNEIIKNRDYNRRYGTKRKIVVVIDEAHVFIDTKYPVALDFMFQLAKRIRKYNGMQIVITQNVKDFVGSEEIARKSTAIINACQYSFIFALAPNDMDDLCKLYEKAGGINESEQDQIVSAPRGEVFAVLGPQSHSTFKIEVPGDIASMFSDAHYQTHYFNGEDGAKNWEDFVGESRDKRQLLQNVTETIEAVEKPHSTVVFEEITEEELARNLARETVRQRAAMPDITPKAEEPIQPIQPIQPVVPQVVVQAPAANTENERLLGELLQKFSYDTIMDEVRRTVRAEMAMQPTPAPSAQPTFAQPDPFASFDPFASQPDPFASSDPFAQPEQPAPQNSVALGSIFDGVTEQGEQAFDPENFDLMSFLSNESESVGFESPISMMEVYDEQVVDVSIEDLVQYLANKQH